MQKAAERVVAQNSPANGEPWKGVTSDLGSWKGRMNLDLISKISVLFRLVATRFIFKQTCLVMELHLLDAKLPVEFFSSPLAPNARVSACEEAPGVWIINRLLLPSECDRIAQTAERHGFSDVDQRQRLLAFETNSMLLEGLQERVQQDLLFKRLGNVSPYGFFDAPGPAWSLSGKLNPCLRVTKYNVGGKFSWHRDSQFTGSALSKSSHTLMIYLNDDFEGGDTTILVPTKSPSDLEEAYVPTSDIDAEVAGLAGHVEEVVIRPKKGMVVLFDQRLIHSGQPVTQGSKYILRSDLLAATDATSPTIATSELQSSLKDLTVKLFRQAQYHELAGQGAEASKLYHLTLSLRANAQRIREFPSHLTELLRPIPASSPLPVISHNNTLMLLSRSGDKHHYRYDVPAGRDGLSAVMDLVKVATLHALVSSTRALVETSDSFEDLLALYQTGKMADGFVPELEVHVEDRSVLDRSTREETRQVASVLASALQLHDPKIVERLERFVAAGAISFSLDQVLVGPSDARCQ